VAAEFYRHEPDGISNAVQASTAAFAMTVSAYLAVTV
jgi:hypothetical protein